LLFVNCWLYYLVSYLDLSNVGFLESILCKVSHFICFNFLLLRVFCFFLLSTFFNCNGFYRFLFLNYLFSISYNRLFYADRWGFLYSLRCNLNNRGFDRFWYTLIFFDFINNLWFFFNRFLTIITRNHFFYLYFLYYFFCLIKNCGYHYF
jgi:hypothetical protein